MVPVLLAGGALACLGLSVVLRRASAAPGRTERSEPSARPGSASQAGRWSVRRSEAAASGGAASTGGLIGFLASHRWARRTLGASSALMVLGAAAAIGYPFLTDQYTHTLQSRLEKQLISGKTRVAYTTRKIPVGSSLTRIRIPKIGLDTVVVEGTTQSALRAGAGHYVDSPLPCEQGNVAIAGHRVTFGHPFKRMAELGPGDEIFLDTPIGSCTYRIATVPAPVDPSDVGVVGPTKDPELTLTTCHPEHSARQRLVLHAKRVATHQEPAS